MDPFGANGLAFMLGILTGLGLVVFLFLLVMVHSATREKVRERRELKEAAQRMAIARHERTTP